MHTSGPEAYLLALGVLLVVSLVVSRVGGRLGIPGLLLFLGVGMLVGTDGLGLQFGDYQLAQNIGTVALCFILFQGGLTTHWEETKPVIKRGVSLATIGVLVTAGIMAVTAHYLLGWTWLNAWLLGAIVSSTDASAVFSVLKERALGLKEGIAPLLEFESGGNDPMAVFLTVGILELITHPGSGVVSILPLFFKEMIIGGLMGVLLGRVALWALRTFQLQFEGLYSVLTLSVALIIFNATAVLGGSGFLAIYIAGVILGNASFIHKRSLLAFHDGLAWLMQVMMFLTLGLLVNPHDLLPTAGLALVCALVLVFVARPVSVFTALAFSSMPIPERAMVGWVGLRGAVPIVLATFPLVAGVPRAHELFNIVFFIVLTSVLLQGTTLGIVANWLGVRTELPTHTEYPISYTPTGLGRNGMVEVAVRPGSQADGKRILDLDLPQEALVILVHRAGEFLIPKGTTALQGEDSLLVLAPRDKLGAVEQRLGQPGQESDLSALKG